MLRETGTQFVKIGWTGDFRRRYASMRMTENPRRILFLGWLSREPLEGHFHVEFAAYSVGLAAGGIEWFEMPEDVIRSIIERCVP